MIDNDFYSVYNKVNETDDVEIKIDRALLESLDGGNKQNAAY